MDSTLPDVTQQRPPCGSTLPDAPIDTTSSSLDSRLRIDSSSSVTLASSTQASPTFQTKATALDADEVTAGEVAVAVTIDTATAGVEATTTTGATAAAEAQATVGVAAAGSDRGRPRLTARGHPWPLRLEKGTGFLQLMKT